MSSPSQTVVTTADGGKFPAIGLGTWKIPNAITSKVVIAAIRSGYHHFDCACDYGNERKVGEGMNEAFRAALCKREDLWVTSKLWNTYHKPKHVRAACERSLLDLYLVNFPIALAFVPFDLRYPPGWFHDPQASNPAMKPIRVPIAETWGAMEQLVRDGLVKRIGVCNFGTSLLRDLLAYCTIRPSVLQVELHPYLAQQRLLRYCRSEQIVVTAFSPLGADSYLPLEMAQPSESVMADTAVIEIASKHSRSPAQVCLRWAVQRGTVAIPKTQRIERQRLMQNLGVFDFALSGDEMKIIDALERNRRFNAPAEFGEKAFNTFFPIFD